MSRRLLALAVALLAAATCVAAVDPLDDLEAGLAAVAASDPEAPRLLHSIRNHRAMAELAAALPAERRPARMLYLASGSHVAPLVACAALPEARPCNLLLTELDSTVQEEIAAVLARAQRTGVLADLASSDPVGTAGGRRRWTFTLGGRPVTLDLVVRGPSPEGEAPSLIEPGELVGVDLVISHDWSGDQLGNLQVIHELLSAARAGGLEKVPMLMIEDLEAHPYPIDLSLFAPLARTAEPYGHRASAAGLGRHGDTELGTPLYGGGVILGFDVPWWRQLDGPARASVLDLLLLSAFDDQRQNVLEGGDDPLMAPALLDWWTGFGRRTVSGPDLGQDPAVRRAAVEDSVALVPLLPADLGRRLACRIRLYRSLLEARAAGFEIRSLMPAATARRRLKPEEFPSDEMRALHREAMRHLPEMRADDRRTVEAIAPLLERLRSKPLVEATAACPCALPAAGPPPDGDAWAAAYRAHAEWLTVN